MLHCKQTFLLIMLLLFGAVGVRADIGGSKLSDKQLQKIAEFVSLLHTSPERSLATGWSDAKKIAEFICRPLALPEIKRQHFKKADRVFLGSDDASSLDLVSNRLLKGQGQVRVGNDWHDFTFQCQLDPQTGKVVSFSITLPDSKTELPQGPGPVIPDKPKPPQ